jgi:DUF4097 and DUF4098 domain-containing protein YvlB
MKMRLALVLAGLVLAPPGAWATDDTRDNREVNEHRPLKADARLMVSNIAGTIEVEAWDRNELSLTGTLGEDVEKLEITGDEKSLRIEVKVPEHGNFGSKDIDSDLRLRVPAGVRLKASGVSADVRVHGLKGEIDVDSVSGDVEVDVASKALRAHSVSGDVRVSAPDATADVETVSGDVIVTARKEIEAKSVSGDVHVQARDVEKLKVETVSGDLVLDMNLVKGADVNAETLSGEVHLRLPAEPEGTLEMETFSGELSSAFTRDIGRTKDYRHDGSGSGRVRLHSFSGDVVVEKR